MYRKSQEPSNTKVPARIRDHGQRHRQNKESRFYSLPLLCPFFSVLGNKKYRKRYCLRYLFFNIQCGRWDLNPHKHNAYKILSLARLQVPTLPQVTLYRPSEDYITISKHKCQQLFYIFQIYFPFPVMFLRILFRDSSLLKFPLMLTDKTKRRFFSFFCEHKKKAV